MRILDLARPWGVPVCAVIRPEKPPAHFFGLGLYTQHAAALHRRPRGDGEKPSPERSEFFQILPMHAVVPNPAPTGDIGDAVIAAGQPLVAFEVAVHYAIKAGALFHEAVSGLFIARRRIATKVMGLAGHRS